MRTILAIIGLLLVGCADLSMPNAIEHKQFAYIREAVDEQARERPPETEREAKRLTDIATVASQGVELTRIELKLFRPPVVDVPDARDYVAVYHATKVFEEEVDADNQWKGLIEPFLPNSGLGNVIGGGGALAIGMSLLKIFLDRKKMQRKDKALGAMFAFTGAHVDKGTIKKELSIPEVQAEYGVSAYKVAKKSAEAMNGSIPKT
jgi:hypothetical protein